MSHPALAARLATPTDAAAIASIYNEGIADRIATFETEPHTAEQVAARAVGVYERHGKIEGEWRDCVIVERLLP